MRRRAWKRCADRTGSRMSCGRSWQNNKNALCMTEGNSEKIGKTDIQSFDGEKHPTVQGCFIMFLT
ncbi:hypothetical protein OkiPb00643_39480 [Escherichia coli]